MNDINFIVVILADNDFGMLLQEALSDLMEEAGGAAFCPIVAKRFIVEHVVSASVRRRILCSLETEWEINQYRKNIENYLTSGVTVTFEKKLPTYDPEGEQPLDHEYGSVYYDMNVHEVFYLNPSFTSHY